MKSKELLFELIQSLTKSEKRFIKLNAQVHGGNKIYLKLLDAIARQKEYDEEELMRLFRGEEFTKQFSVAKNYLQNFILKQLRQYHSKLKANIECKNLLIDIEILFWKGQYKLAEKLIAKTEKFASKYELFLVLEELNYWHGRIYSALLKLDKSSVKKTTEKHQNNLARYQNIVDYRALISKAHLLTKQSEVVRDDEEYDEYQKLLNNPLLQDINNAQSYDAKYSFYVLNSVLQRIAGNIDESANYRIKLVKFIEDNPCFLEENPIQYIASIHNLLMHSLIVHDHELFNDTITKFRKHNFKMPHEKANMFSSLCLFELGYYTEYGEYDKAKEFVENTVVKYESVNSLLNLEHEFLLHYHAALAYYYLEDYSVALGWINKVINLTSKDLRVDVRASTYVLNILTHYELDNLELLPYLVKSVLNYYRTIKMHRKIDEYFLSMFKNIPSKTDKKALISFLEKKRIELIQIKDQSMIVSDISYLDWIDSKIQGVSLAIIRNNKLST